MSGEVEDRQALAHHLREAQIIARYNYRLLSQLAQLGAKRDTWSAVLGHIENALSRLDQ